MSKESDRDFARGVLRSLLTKDLYPGDIRNLLAEIERETPRYTRTSPTGVVDYDPPRPEIVVPETKDPIEGPPEEQDAAASELYTGPNRSFEIDTAVISKRDPRLPPIGETISREYNGTEHHVCMLETGFLYMGEEYGSLSAIAKKITGLKACNGFAFFGLT